MFKKVSLTVGDVKLLGHLSHTAPVKAWIIFAHGSGSSHKSKRNNWVAGELNKAGFGTLLFDLLTETEDQTFLNRFNIPLLASRLRGATEWLLNQVEYKGEGIGYFGASTGAAAALMAARLADVAWPLFAIVSRGGRPDLVLPEILHEITIPTLLIVGGHDFEVLEFNESSQSHLSNAKLAIVPGATHLFEEPGAMGEVVKMSSAWFSQNLAHSLGRDERRGNDFSG